MEWIPTIWVLSGWAAWLWIVIREDMFSSFGDGLVSLVMLFPAAVGGPVFWLVVAVAELDRPHG